MIEKGHMIVDGNVAEVMRKARQRIMLNIRVKERTEAAGKLFEQLDEVESVNITKDQLLEVTMKPTVEDYSALPTELVNAGFRITLFREEEVNLETAFLQLTKGLVQ
jgi:ABC-2 type transport system ATP-binding protein